ncbi:MAG TPA: HAMP domain-containing sensor histidine kinase [Steroidobacteraceae bacterium]|jgi:signal transduction histidine kinase|nr:HAMP domain-containing sensor histidine kinase [Steroidobacteraceae bacterium]
MGFDIRWPLVWRLGAVVALTVAVSLLLERTNFYATSLVALLLAGALSADLLRTFHRPAVSQPRQVSGDAPADHLQALLDTVAAALIVVDGRDRATAVNRAAHRLGRGAIHALSDLELLGPESAARLESLPPGRSILLQRVDGRHVFVSCSQLTTPLEQRRLMALQFVSGELDAVEIKAWRDMLRVLRHEIMNSLTPIASLSESITAAPPATDARESLEAIGRRSRGLMHFVERYRQVLEPLESSPALVDGTALLKDIERLLAADFTAAGVTSSFTADPSASTFEADASLIEQAVINLLKNSLDAARGIVAPRIQVRLGEVDGEICFSVGDNGCGIAPGLREQIFVPFYSTKATGSGVGLSMARNIALAHGGRISYRPNEPTGSVFELRFPRRLGQMREPRPPDSPASSAATGSSDIIDRFPEI